MILNSKDINLRIKADALDTRTAEDYGTDRVFILRPLHRHGGNADQHGKNGEVPGGTMNWNSTAAKNIFRTNTALIDESNPEKQR